MQFLSDPNESVLLERRYQEAVDSLSVYDPLLAYQLSGKAAAKPLEEKLDTYLNSLAQNFGPPQTLGDQKLFESLGPYLKSEGLEYVHRHR